MNTNEKNRKVIEELFKIVSTKSILVVDRFGVLRRIFCPFNVIAKVDLHPYIVADTIYEVNALKMTLELEEVFIINDRGYFIWYFKIV